MKKKNKKNGTGGIQTPVTGVAARNAADWATQALDSRQVWFTARI